MSRTAATDEWITRVLGCALSGAATVKSAPTGQPDGAGAAPSKTGDAPGIRYRKLLLRWRAAQSELSANVDRLGRAVLARDDVKADPRFPEVEDAVARLPGLVPRFGGELEDLLDQGLNLGSADGASRLAIQAVSAIDAYRQQVDGASQLAELEALADSDMGGRFPLSRALDDALAELRADLSQRFDA